MAFCYNTYRIEQHQADEDRATDEQERADANGLTVEDQEAEDEATRAENRYQDMMDEYETMMVNRGEW